MDRIAEDFDAACGKPKIRKPNSRARDLLLLLQSQMKLVGTNGNTTRRIEWIGRESR